MRFGDPETQVVVPRLALRPGRAPEPGRRRVASATEPAFVDDAAVTVVVAAEGYPRSPRTGDEIEGSTRPRRVEGVTVFCAGVAADDRRPAW